jgi:hypothetical protein
LLLDGLRAEDGPDDPPEPEQDAPEELVGLPDARLVDRAILANNKHRGDDVLVYISLCTSRSLPSAREAIRDMKEQFHVDRVKSRGLQLCRAEQNDRADQAEPNAGTARLSSEQSD